MNSNLSNSNNNQSLPVLVQKILWRQQQELIKKHPDGVNIIINEEDALDIQADIQGPKGTPYEGGLFRVRIVISEEFPQVAPKGYFVTKIYHPNVSEKGEICVNTLKKDWDSKKWSLFSILEVIKCLLIIPFPESSLNEEAGKLFMEDYNNYFKVASIYTSVHATLALSNNEEKYFNDSYQEFKDYDVEMSESSVSIESEKDVANPKFHRSFTDENAIFDFNLLRHSKSVNLKSSQLSNLTKVNMELPENIYHRRFTQIEKYKEINSTSKINIDALPYIRRSSFNSNNCVNNFHRNSNIENENYSNIIYQQNTTNLFNGVITSNQTPKSKKDEIKKWLSRM